MFNLKSFTTLLALGVLSATAAPQVTKENTLEARQWTAHVFACHYINWGTPCGTFLMYNNEGCEDHPKL